VAAGREGAAAVAGGGAQKERTVLSGSPSGGTDTHSSSDEQPSGTQVLSGPHTASNEPSIKPLLQSMSCSQGGGVQAPSTQERAPAAAPADSAVAAEAAASVPAQPVAEVVPTIPPVSPVAATAPDGSEIGNAAAGWTADPAADEFSDLKVNRDLLERLAHATGGQTVAPQDLEQFASTLPTRHVQITEPFIRPLWHQPWVFLLAIICLTAEWGMRRWRGLP